MATTLPHGLIRPKVNRSATPSLRLRFYHIIRDTRSRGLDVELEHGTIDLHTNVTNDDSMMTGKIALAHLNEFPDYYTRLAKMEKEAEGKF